MKSAARAPSPRCSRRILRLRTASRIRKKRLRASCPQNRNISSPPRSSTPSRLACATSCSRPRPRTTRPASPLCAPRPSNPKSSRMATIRIAPTTIALRSSVVPILNRDQRTLKTNFVIPSEARNLLFAFTRARRFDCREKSLFHSYLVPTPSPARHSEPSEQSAFCFLPHLVQFGSPRGLQGSHIGGHIVYIYNVSANALTGAVASVWEGSDEEMGPLTGFVSRRVSREGRQSAVGGLHRSASDSVGAVAQGSSPTRCDRAH